MKNIITVVLLSLTNLAHAAGAGDPFAKASSKLTEFSTLLGGSIAIVIVTIAVIFCGYRLLMNVMKMETAYRIIGAAIIIGSASAIGGYLMA